MAANNRSAPPLPETFEDDGMDLSIVDLSEVSTLEADGSHQGIGRRVARHPADREHGIKTRVRSKQIVSGRPYSS